MKRLLWILLALFAVAAALWVGGRKPPPPEVKFVRAAHEPLSSELTTNGKVEPSEWAPVRADRAGRIETLHVTRGAQVSSGAPLVTLDAQADKDDVARAEARIGQVKAEIAQLDAGGRSADRAALDASLANARVDAAQVRREIGSVERLLEKKAATTKEKVDLQDRLARIESDIRGLESRRAALTDTSDKAAAEARLREAQATLDAARLRLERSVIRASRSGEVYNLPVRAGAYLQPGDLVAEIGDLDRLRVLIYVDEPELGNVKLALPVTITWDGLAGREWKGVVDKLPVQVTAQGNRQVGEVQSLVENQSRELKPGANINVHILTARLDNALVIPKECISREKGESAVYVLNGAKVDRRVVKIGVSSVAKSEIVSGLKEGESVAVLTDQPLTDGEPVRAVD